MINPGTTMQPTRASVLAMKLTQVRGRSITGWLYKVTLVAALCGATVMPGTASQAEADGRAAIAAPTQLNYTGKEQAYVVPKGVRLLGVGVQGAWGGSVGGPQATGQGIEGYLRVKPGEKLYAEVGQNGSYAGGRTFGGGGASGAPPPGVCRETDGTPCPGALASSGGGASDVRTCSSRAHRCRGGITSRASRLIVAAGGGGNGGSGNSFATVGCSSSGSGGAGENIQPLPSGGSVGPLPIVTSKGIVVPGLATGNHRSVLTVDGARDAAMGTTKAGKGGFYAGCTTGGVTRSQSVAGSSGSRSHGGRGGNASGLAPANIDNCASRQDGCADAGAGGGGGGGYFGGGGGATGLNACTTASGPCNSAGGGEGGAAGSSFFSKRVIAPYDAGVLGSTGQVFVRLVPTIEIDKPRDPAVYSPGQIVKASWSCGYDSSTGLGIGGNNCVGTLAPGVRISTTPGTHRFTVQGKIVYQGKSFMLRSTVKYVVKAK